MIGVLFCEESYALAVWFMITNTQMIVMSFSAGVTVGAPVGNKKPLDYEVYEEKSCGYWNETITKVIKFIVSCSSYLSYV